MRFLIRPYFDDKITNGPYTPCGNEERYVSNLGIALANNSHSVDILGLNPTWGDSKIINNMNLLSNPSGDYDFYTDGWWASNRGKQTARYYLIPLFSMHPVNEINILIKERNCGIMYGVKQIKGLDDLSSETFNPYVNKSFFVPYPFFKEKLRLPNIESRNIIFVVRCFTGERITIETLHNLEIIAKTNDMHLIIIHEHRKDGYSWDAYYDKNFCIRNFIENKENITTYEKLPYDKFLQVLSNCKIFITLNGSIAGGLPDAISNGCIPFSNGGIYFNCINFIPDDLLTKIPEYLKNDEKFKTDVLDFQRGVIGHSEKDTADAMMNALSLLE